MPPLTARDLVVDGEFAVSDQPSRHVRVRKVPSAGYGHRARDHVKIVDIREDVRFIAGKKKVTKLFDVLVLASDVDDNHPAQAGKRTLTRDQFLCRWDEYAAERRQYFEQLKRDEAESGITPAVAKTVITRAFVLLKEHGVEINEQQFNPDIQIRESDIEDSSFYRDRWEIYFSLDNGALAPLLDAERKRRLKEAGLDAG